MRHFAFFVVVGAIAVVASPLDLNRFVSTLAFAQTAPNTTFIPAPEQRLKKPPERKSSKPEKLDKPDKGEAKLVERAQGLPYGYWFTPSGNFHTNGYWARGIYMYGVPYDTTWTYTDSEPVGNTPGWTYAENEFADFYMFFSSVSVPGCNGRGALAYSHDNKTFQFFGCSLAPPE